MDIGQEQSSSHVVHLAWSASGLAIHDRPILAIVTANGIASLWMSLTDTTEAGSWQRVLVVNNHMDTPAQRASLDEDAIRSVAWLFVPSAESTEVQRKGDFILGVANDAGNIRLFKVSSPYCGRSKDWTLSQLCSFELPMVTSTELNGHLFNDWMERNTGAKQIGFGPLFGQADYFSSLLSCVSTENLNLFSIRLQRSMEGDIYAQVKPLAAMMGSSLKEPVWCRPPDVSLFWVQNDHSRSLSH